MASMTPGYSVSLGEEVSRRSEMRSTLWHEVRMSTRRVISSDWDDPMSMSRARTNGARAVASAKRKVWNRRIAAPFVSRVGRMESRRRMATGRKEELAREMAQTSPTLLRKSHMVIKMSSFSSGTAILQFMAK